MNTKINTPFVCFNNFKGGYMAAQFLINLGHSKIACFTGRLTHQSTLDRSEGFKKALAESGKSVEGVRILNKGVHFEDSAASIVIEWAKKEKMPSAIFAYNDLLAYEIIGTLMELGLSVPGDVSVLGFDNVRMARYFRPPLTTINQSMETIGKFGAKMLMSLIQGNTLNKNKITIEPEIIIRDSCDKPNLRRIL